MLVTSKTPASRCVLLVCKLMHKLGIIAAVCGSLPVLAWGPEGHNLVARIAEAQLTPAAHARVMEILGPNVTMASVSSWPDQVRRQRQETSHWHYVDIPINQPRLDFARDCAKDDCVVAQITIEETVLCRQRAEDNNTIIAGSAPAFR